MQRLGPGGRGQPGSPSRQTLPTTCYIEVLSPRYEFDSNEMLEKKRKRKLSKEQPVSHLIFKGLSAAQLCDPREILKAFKQAEQVSYRDIS